MIFALNTTTEQFSLALMDNQGIVRAESLILGPEKNYTSLMPGVQSLFRSSNTALEEIKAITVAIGPGSFTGLRVGLSLAKGMAQGLKIPIIGVSSLEAMALQAFCIDLPICPVITSRKDEVFFAMFQKGPDNALSRLAEDASIRLEELPLLIKRTTLFIGNDLKIQGPPLKKVLDDLAILAPPHQWNLKASSIGAIGLNRYQNQDFDDLQDLVPSYMRPPDIRPSPFPPILSTD
jgi:tRNA threonylcarbamoyladenosine biosynthesis protein TsaB